MASPLSSTLRIAHVNLSVDNVESARFFYQEVLGLEPAPRPPDAARKGCWFKAGPTELHLSEELGADNAKSKRRVAFETQDLQPVRDRLTQAGFQISGGSPMAGVERFFVRDPAGNRIELYRVL